MLMRAARYDRNGPAAEVLEVTEVERPEPGPGEVRVRLAVSGVNPTDWKIRSGATSGPPTQWQIPGQDGAGTVDAIGPGVDPGRAGPRVWVWSAAAGRRWGTAAQWTVVPQHQAVALPDGVSFDLGAMLGVPAMTAHRCLYADDLVEGADVLVAGGAGAVGHFAIELARHAGARVAATVSSGEKGDLARRAGADEVVDYRRSDAAEQLRAFAPVFDRIVEVAFGANLDLDLAVSGPQTVISVYATAGADPVLPLRRCMTANVAVRFVLLYGVPPAALGAAATAITGALAAGALTPLPVHRYSLEQIVAAHEAVEAGAVGKVLVDLSL